MSPQPQSELPHSATPPQQAVRKPKRPAQARLVPSGADSWVLSDGWELAQTDRLVGSDGSLFDSAYDTSAWYNAVVPGTVLTSLVEAGVYPDPYYGLNNLSIPDSLCRTEWWYGYVSHSRGTSRDTVSGCVSMESTTAPTCG